jgi:glycosyltransferase involved in cell wall biosynthesis
MNALRPDLVHTTLFESDVAGRSAAWLSRRPVVTSYVSTGFELGAWRSRAGLRARGAVAVDAATARLATAFHAVSEPVADATASRLHLPRERFTVIPRGRDEAALGRRTVERRSRTRAALGVAGSTPLVLALGRQVTPKSHETLLRAVPYLREKIPSSMVALAGATGDASPVLESLLDELDLREHVMLLGHRTDAADLLSAADVLAHPSVREGFPGALVEALALECPIVASDIPTVRAVVEDPHFGVLATLVPPRDPERLAAGLLAVLDGPPETPNGRVRFEQHFTTRAVATETARWYRNAVDRGRR